MPTKCMTNAFVFQLNCLGLINYLRKGVNTFAAVYFIYSYSK